jgi:two-component system, LytTR family, sensor kinase
MSNDPRPLTVRRTAVALAIVTIPALLSTFETVMFARLGGRPIAAWRAFVGEAPQWYTWVLLTPAIVAVGARLRIGWPPALRSVAVHVFGAVAASGIVAWADAIVNSWVRPSSAGVTASFLNWFISGLPATTLVYAAIVAGSYALGNAARLRERERRTALLEAELREAQLGALRMQLQPHFLFNSLNAVMALVRDRETDRAVRALSLLSDVLRTTMTASDAHETTLASELEFVRRYLEIERVRFEDRLVVSVDAAPELADALVPSFVLQPFVENSLKHGVLRERGGNAISLGARADGGTLVLTVRDDGHGLVAPMNGGNGVGIANARARLFHMYGADARLTVGEPAEGPGVLVEIAFPLRRALRSPEPRQGVSASR